MIIIKRKLSELRRSIDSFLDLLFVDEMALVKAPAFSECVG